MWPGDLMLRKFVKLTGYTHGCNILTDFENNALAMTGNGSQVNLLKLDLKTREITMDKLMFWRIFDI